MLAYSGLPAIRYSCSMYSKAPAVTAQHSRTRVIDSRTRGRRTLVHSLYMFEGTQVTSVVVKYIAVVGQTHIVHIIVLWQQGLAHSVSLTVLWSNQTLIFHVGNYLKVL